jgi:DNA primase
MSEPIRRRRIVENTSIAEVVSEYVPLHGDGASLRSLCPFHDDRFYTFRLDSGTKSFMCSACGALGDVVDFVRMFESVTLSEALDMLETWPKA